MAAKTKALVKWDEELAKQAQLATSIEENVGGGGTMVGTANGRLKYKGAEVPGNKLNVVIIDHILFNNFYEGTYDPSTPQTPVCYAYGRSTEDLKPHEKAAKPQHEQCEGCENNEFGSANVGKGKACKNSRRLAIIAEGDLENVADAEVAYVHVPVTSVKGWAGYVRQLSEVLKRPPLGVVTEISLVPDAKSQFKMNFKMLHAIEDGAHIGALLERRKLVEKEINFAYVQIEGAAPAAAQGKGKGKAAAAGAKRRKF